MYYRFFLMLNLATFFILSGCSEDKREQNFLTDLDYLEKEVMETYQQTKDNYENISQLYQANLPRIQKLDSLKEEYNFTTLDDMQGINSQIEGHEATLAEHKTMLDKAQADKLNYVEAKDEWEVEEPKYAIVKDTYSKVLEEEKKMNLLYEEIQATYDSFLEEYKRTEVDYDPTKTPSKDSSFGERTGEEGTD